MKYSIAKMKALEFFEERKETVKIAKSNKKEDYYLLFGDEKPSKNYTIIENVDSSDS